MYTLKLENRNPFAVTFEKQLNCSMCKVFFLIWGLWREILWERANSNSATQKKISLFSELTYTFPGNVHFGFLFPGLNFEFHKFNFKILLV